MANNFAGLRVARAAPPGTRRGDILPGQIFSIRKKDGSISTKQYAAIGNNGKMYSVNMKTGELASTANRNSPVVVVGKFHYNFSLTPGKAGTAQARGTLKDGTVFAAKQDDPEALYMAVGKLDDGRWLSVNLVNGNHATTDNGRRDVYVVGKGEFVVETVR